MPKEITCAKLDSTRIALAFDATSTTYALVTLWAFKYDGQPYGQIDITYSQHLDKHEKQQTGLVDFKKVELRKHDLFTCIVMADRAVKALTGQAARNREKYLNQIFTKWGV